MPLKWDFPHYRQKMIVQCLLHHLWLSGGCRKEEKEKYGVLEFSFFHVLHKLHRLAERALNLQTDEPASTEWWWTRDWGPSLLCMFAQRATGSEHRHKYAEVVRSVRLQQNMFLQAKSQSDGASKASFIPKEETKWRRLLKSAERGFYVQPLSWMWTQWSEIFNISEEMSHTVPDCHVQPVHSNGESHFNTSMCLLWLNVPFCNQNAVKLQHHEEAWETFKIVLAGCKRWLQLTTNAALWLDPLNESWWVCVFMCHSHLQHL